MSTTRVEIVWSVFGAMSALNVIGTPPRRAAGLFESQRPPGERARIGEAIARGPPFELEKVLPWLWFRMGGVTDVDAALDGGGWFFKTIGNGQVLLPWGATDRVIRKIDATDPNDLTLAEIECRKKVMEAVDQLRRDVPQFKDAHICDIARDLGITESRRMIGAYVLTRDDMDRRLDDAIALSPATGRSTAPSTGSRTNRSWRTNTPTFSLPVAASPSITAPIMPPRRFRRAWPPAKPPAPRRRWRSRRAFARSRST